MLMSVRRLFTFEGNLGAQGVHFHTPGSWTRAATGSAAHTYGPASSKHGIWCPSYRSSLSREGQHELRRKPYTTVPGADFHPSPRDRHLDTHTPAEVCCPWGVEVAVPRLSKGCAAGPSGVESTFTDNSTGLSAAKALSPRNCWPASSSVPLHLCPTAPETSTTMAKQRSSRPLQRGTSLGPI